MLKNHLEFGAACMNVCGECGELSGAFVDVADEVERTQRCRCGGEAREQEATWPGYDFNRGLELCRCCAGALVSSGSRWSSFFCDACGDDIHTWNRTGAGGIPVHWDPGGATVSGGQALVESARELAGQPVDGAALARRLHGLAARIAYLDAWRLRLTRDALGRMNGHTSLPDYLAAVRAGRARQDLFVELKAYFDARVEELDAARQALPENTWPKVTPPRVGRGLPSWADISALYVALRGGVASPEDEAEAKAHFDDYLAKRREGERRFAQHVAQLRFFEIEGFDDVEPEPKR
jgi:AcrR family transcriptional regulator